MKKILLIVLTTVLAISSFYGQSSKIEVKDRNKDSRMEWWRNARFGMFIHWGLYSIPAGEWNGETNHAEWIRATAQIPLETYEKFLKQFNPTKFNADKWVQTAKNAGMKYIVITSKHHDGFCLFDSKYTDFDVMSTPFKRDILKELSDAAQKYGIKLGFYYSIMDWHHPDYLPRREWETNWSTKGADFNRYRTYMKNQLKELLTNYNISILWFDGEWDKTWNHQYAVDLYNYLRQIKPDIIINNRIDVGRGGMAGMTKEGYLGDFGTPEQEIPANGFPDVDWESCITMNKHWGYNKVDTNWKSPKEIIKMLTNIISKGGNLLLNVGPKPNGEFPEKSIEILKEVGHWLAINKEAIFDSEPTPFEHLNFGNCTQKNIGGIAKLYFILFDWPSNSVLTISGIRNKPLKAYLLSDKNKAGLEIKRDKDDIFISLKNIKPSLMNNVVVLDIYGQPDIIAYSAIKHNDGINMKKILTEKQITFSPKTHALDNNDNFSYDDKFVCYDTRGTVFNYNLANCKSIEKVEIATGKETVLWNPPNVTGENAAPGVAAASFHPKENKVIFIHGPFLDEVKERGYYNIRNRTAMVVDGNGNGIVEKPDMRDVKNNPTTPGAHRGGSHRHEYTHSGNRIGFTYDDYPVQKFDRTIAFMQPSDKAPQGCTHYFSLIVRPAEKGKSKQGEIERAANDSWVDSLGTMRAFIGKVRAENGVDYYYDLFVADIPLDIDITTAKAGTKTEYPTPAAGIIIRRLTNGMKAGGIVRGSYDGKNIVFTAEDNNGIKQVFIIKADASQKEPRKISNFTENASAVRWHPSDKWIFCITGGNIAAINVAEGKTTMLTNDNQNREQLAVSHDGKTLAYVIPTLTKNKEGKIVKDVSGNDFRQIFILNIKNL